MTAQGHRVAALAHHWIGTPYVHQAACRGAGSDCLGLLRGIWCELYGAEPELVPAYSMDWSEPQGEERLWQAALRHLLVKPLAQAALGDVILFRMRSGAVAKHLGVQSSVGAIAQGADARFIHAYSGHGVVESPLSAPWQRRIVARFQFPEETV
ncbi:C40 family peptidase [Parasedimentitalea psychrophila]|uniref:Peptidase n=1 Tax=Parasedimentitalea psychrophila TaxID=2997337 RepID=A0A9Y2P5R1_9RHOB|nr:peptidase [Parasedimentitalea psychrophila]WIY24228.1 peptidase [Parasedimentitalea psychrophila]